MKLVQDTLVGDGALVSTFAGLEVTDVVLQFPAASHTCTELFVHVEAAP